MNRYEKLLIEVPKDIFVDDQAVLKYNTKGYYTNECGVDLILINKKANTAEKSCLLMEEVGHYYTTVGDITDQTKIENRKQELKARRWAVKRLIRIEDFISAFEAGVRNRHELAEFLEVTEEFIETTIDHFKGIYGHSLNINNYVIYFSPLWILKKFE